MAGTEIGSSGLSVAYDGTISEELLPNLQGRRALDTFRTMKDNDALVGAILFAIEMLARQVEWDVEQGEAKEEHADFVRECMEDMSQSWGDVVSEALSMIPFGFAFQEIVYKERRGPQKETAKIPSSRFNDGKTGWRKIALRAQESLDHWEFDEEGGTKAFVQRDPNTLEEKPIPMQKGLLFRTSVYKNNPEGRSLLRNAYISWFYKRRIQAIEGTGIERDLAGFPVFWLPAEVLNGTDPAHQNVVNAFRTLGENIRRDKSEYLLMPLAYDANGNKQYEFSLTASAGTRTFDLSATIARYNKEIAMTVLADFILLGHENVGSFALSDDKTDLFAVALGTLLDNIADVFNRYAIPRLFELNGFPMEELPKIVHRDIEKPDLAKLGQFLGSMTGAGVTLFPDEELEAYLREVAGLPEKSEEAKKAQEEADAQEEDGGNDEFGSGGNPEGLEGEGAQGDPGSVDLTGL